MPETVAIPRFRVSDLESFRRWEEDGDADLQEILDRLTHDRATEDMKRGTAFHGAMERLAGGVVDRIDTDGFTFLFDGEFEVPEIRGRELRAHRNYGGIEVTGCADAIVGKTIIDHKASTYFDAEQYLRGYQWRYYLDIFDADRFVWCVWEMKETDDPRTFQVQKMHSLEQFRYPALRYDCTALAQRFKTFAAKHLVATYKG